MLAVDAHRRGEPARDPFTQRLLQPPQARHGAVPGTLWMDLSHFWVWEIRFALRCQSPTGLLRQVQAEAALSLALMVAAVWVAAPYYASSSLFIVFTLLMNVVTVSGGLVCWSCLRLRAAQRIAHASTQAGMGSPWRAAWTQFVRSAMQRSA